MLRRFKVSAGTPTPPSGARVDHVTVLSETSNTEASQTYLIGGPASGFITLQVTTYGASHPSDQYFNVNGVGNLVLGNTFMVSTDSLGNANFKTIICAGSTHGGINVVLTIVAVSGGLIGSPSTRGYSKTA